MNLSSLPALNASLNFTTSVLLIVSYLFIRRGLVKAHVICQVMALCLGMIFLASYLYYHSHHGMTRFSGQGLVRIVYFFILTTHTILAAIIVPMVLRTFYLAIRRDWDKHKRLARWTMPIWLYVSITGVVVYWMLYQMRYTL